MSTPDTDLFVPAVPDGCHMVSWTLSADQAFPTSGTLDGFVVHPTFSDKVDRSLTWHVNQADGQNGDRYPAIFATGDRGVTFTEVKSGGIGGVSVSNLRPDPSSFTGTDAIGGIYICSQFDIDVTVQSDVYTPQATFQVGMGAGLEIATRAVENTRIRTRPDGSGYYANGGLFFNYYDNGISLQAHQNGYYGGIMSVHDTGAWSTEDYGFDATVHIGMDLIKADTIRWRPDSIAFPDKQPFPYSSRLSVPTFTADQLLTSSGFFGAPYLYAYNYNGRAYVRNLVATGFLLLHGAPPKPTNYGTLGAAFTGNRVNFAGT